MNRQDEVNRGDEAKRILDSAVYKAAWQSYERALVDLLASADTTPEKAVELRALLIAARKADSHLRRIMQEGFVAADAIRRDDAQRKNLAQRLRAAF